jgi:ketosteroid isomerase-like protein
VDPPPPPSRQAANPRRYIAPMSDGTVFRTLVDTFGTGWERGDVEQICSVFSGDAVFLETPFGRPDRGIAAIRDYWKDIALHQAETKFSSGEIYVAGPWFATEFRCTFRRRRTGEQVDARGAMFCETREGTISEMRLYWHRQTGVSGSSP